MFVVRTDLAGRPDPTFGTQGVQSIAGPVGQFRFPQAIAAQPDGRIVAVVIRETPRAALVHRLLPDGTEDPSFGQGGVAEIVVPGFARLRDTTALHVTPSGSLLFADSAYRDGSPTLAAFYFARLLPSGAIDSTYGNGGFAFAFEPIVLTSDAPGVALRPDGGVVFAGYRREAAGDQLVVGRLRADGTTDFSFGAGGELRLGNLPARGLGLALVGDSVHVAGLDVNDSIWLYALTANGSMQQAQRVGALDGRFEGVFGLVADARRLLLVGTGPVQDAGNYVNVAALTTDAIDAAGIPVDAPLALLALIAALAFAGARRFRRR